MTLTRCATQKLISFFGKSKKAQSEVCSYICSEPAPERKLIAGHFYHPIILEIYMFGFLKKKLSTQDGVATLRKLAEDSKVDVVYKNGDYCGFLICLKVDGATLARSGFSTEALSAFVGVIEDRIKNGAYLDSGRDFDREMEDLGLPIEKKNLNVARVVIGPDETPLFNWGPDQ